MEHSEILYLIEKLRSKTISQEELKRLHDLFHKTDGSKELLRLMREQFDEISRSSEILPDHDNHLKIKDQLLENIHRNNLPTKKQTKRYYWIAGLAAISVMAGVLFFSRKQADPVQEIEWVTVTTKHGERKKVSLSDGSHVLLNGNTTLSFPKQILDDLRMVKLDGEAFFEAAKRPEKPFLIISRDFTTQVVGTSFNVDTDIAKTVEVNTGIVHVFALQGAESLTLLQDNGSSESMLSNLEKKSTAKVVLHHGEKAILNEEGRWTVAEYKYKNWFSNELAYLNQPMSQVVKKAYRNYGDSIALHASLAEKNITITFRNKSKEQVIQTLSEICNGKLIYDHETNIWHITK